MVTLLSPFLTALTFPNNVANVMLSSIFPVPVVGDILANANLVVVCWSGIIYTPLAVYHGLYLVAFGFTFNALKSSLFA